MLASDEVGLVMRTHIQGTALLIMLLLVFWYALNVGTTIISKALTDNNGAIAAVAKTKDEALYELLNQTEVAVLQAKLLEAGYELGPLDGILGVKTRAAIEAAKTALGLEKQPDRLLLLVLIDGQEGQDSNVVDSSENVNSNTDSTDH